MEKGKPVSVLDVASYILEKQPKKGPLTAWKLQKLVYYSQVSQIGCLKISVGSFMNEIFS